MHHTTVKVKHIYIKRENVARGLIQLELTYKTTTIRLNKYLYTSTDRMLQLVITHEKQQKSIQLVKKVKIC